MIRRDFPWEGFECKLSAWRASIPFAHLAQDLQACLDEYLSFCNEIGHPSNKGFWDKELLKLSKPRHQNKQGKPNSDVTCQLLLDEWQKSLDQARSEWELQLIEEQRIELLEKLKQLLYV